MFWALAFQAHAQQIDIDGNFRDAEYYLFENRYEKALPFYLQLYKADSTNYTVNYRIGECYFHILREQDKALPYLEKAAQNVSRRFVNEKYEQNVSHINTYLMLGELYQMKELLGKAFQYYKKYQKILRPNEKDELEKVKQRIKSVYVAWELQQLYVPYSAVGLGDDINTRHSDYNPVLSANQDEMAYTSYWETTDVIFFTWKENGKWRKPYNITEMIGSQGDCYTSAIAPDGKTLYLVKQDFYDSDFYYTTYQDNRWLPMNKMSNRINSSSLETSLFISNDGQTLLFSSNRSGGQGNLDIYMSEATEKDDWEKPENIGPVINTSFDEEAPFLVNNGELLFFSSKGHHSMGGYDIFFSTKKEDGTWSKPINIGYPINTSGDDLFYVPFGDGNTGYFVRDLPGGNGLMDIYKIEIPKHLLFQDKLADFDTKYESGFYNDVFAEYTDAEAEKDYTDSNVVEMVDNEPVTLVNTDRFVSGSGEISHVVKKMDTTQSTEKNLPQTKKDTIQPAISNTGEESIQADDNAKKADFIRFDADAGTTHASVTTIPPTPPVKKVTGAGGAVVSSKKPVNSSETSRAIEPRNNDTSISTEGTYNNKAVTNEKSKKDEPRMPTDADTKQPVSSGSNNDTNTPSPAKTKEQSVVKQANNIPKSNQTRDGATIANANDHPVKHADVSTNNVPVYTVQIIALLNPVEASYFSQFDSLTVSNGHDGFTRYTIGEYKGYSAAEQALKKIHSRGYKEAFIRDIRTISNYNKAL
jgi:hypothetical protein